MLISLCLWSSVFSGKFCCCFWFMCRCLAVYWLLGCFRGCLWLSWCLSAFIRVLFICIYMGLVGYNQTSLSAIQRPGRPVLVVTK